MEAQPKIFGILNLSPDSFFDGGKYSLVEKARLQIDFLLAQGVYAIDVGVVSSNPDAKMIPKEEEIARFQSVYDDLQQSGVKISLDCFCTAVQKEILSWEPDYVNDIHGFSDPSLYEILAQSKAKLIVMHSVQKSGKADIQNLSAQGMVEKICHFFEKRIEALTQAKISADRLILDPGMGFFLSSDPQCSIEVLRALPVFKKEFGLPLLVSTSNKSFLRKITHANLEDCHVPTALSEIYAFLHGAEMIRTHEPRHFFHSYRLLKALQPNFFSF